MNTKLWILTIVSLVLAIGTVEAFADSGWHYDEGNNTIVHSYTGSPVSRSTSPSEEQHTGTWHYEEEFGTENLLQALDKYNHLPLQGLKEYLAHELYVCSNGKLDHDDVTFIFAEVTEKLPCHSQVAA